jgi:hypothetical protein
MMVPKQGAAEGINTRRATSTRRAIDIAIGIEMKTEMKAHLIAIESIAESQEIA